MSIAELQAMLAEEWRAIPAEQVMKRAKRFAQDPCRSELGRPVKVAVLSGFLTDYLADTLVLMLARRGIAAEMWRGPYGVMTGAILDHASGLHSFGPDLVLLLPSHRDLMRAPSTGASVEEARSAASAEAEIWRSLWRRLKVPIVQLTFDPPEARPLGDLDGFCTGGLLDHVRRVNRCLADDRPGHVVLVDAEWLATRVGLERWHDARLYDMCKQPFTFDILPIVADAVAGAAASALGLGRKCLVLDLDNTLWGGEVGDVGTAGITLGPETPEGAPFVAFQRYCKRLSQRGVVLAVCSKNDDAIARAPFLEHSAMVLSLDDIACFVANFEDKASNIRLISRTLNLGLDAMVFVDDHPVERAWIRNQIPEVQVVDLPQDPAGFVRAVDDSGAFPVARLTAEDVGRAKSYRLQSTLAESRATAADMDDFLASLQTRAIIEPVTPSSRDRIVQIIAKTNQFKLNAQLFGAADIDRRATDVLAIRLTDKLQDYGIVAVAVTSATDRSLHIDNWVMSCRVFSRRLEYATRQVLAQRAAARGLESLSLTYQPGPKNGLIADLLPRLGFAKNETDEWIARVDPSTDLPAHHITIVDMQ
jgi:FkbH-like protein